MWCVGHLTTEYRQRMYDLLDLLRQACGLMKS